MDEPIARPKRPRDETDDIVEQALREEKAEKEAKKRAKAGVPVKDKGKSLAEIETEEGGPIKESLVAMASTQRATNRKREIAVDDTELVADVAAVEEQQQVEEDEDAGRFTAFNLEEERATGHFDEDGSYVERKEERDDMDAWLDSVEGGKAVSKAVLAKIAAREKAQHAEDAAAPLSGRQIAELKSRIAALMQPRETIPRLLKRLGGSRPGPRKAPPKKGAPAAAAGKKAAPTAEEAAALAAIDMVTEAASQLMLAGETDVYEDSKEVLERAAALYALRGGPAGAGPSNAAADSDEDMFGDDFDASKAKAGPSAAAPAAAATAPAVPAAVPAEGGGTHATSAVGAGNGGQRRAAAAAAAAGGRPQGESDYSAWPVKELRRFLQERGEDIDGIVEKGDLVARVAAAAAAGPQGEAPPGYLYDATSGYYYNKENGMYYDTRSRGYYDSNSGKWYSWDASSSQFVEYPAQ